MIENIHPSDDAAKAFGRAIEKRIEKYVGQLESDLDPGATQKMRGRLSELRSLLKDLRELPQQ